MVFGPHGCGKGHLLKTITGHLKPTDGDVLFPPHFSALQLGYTPQVISWISLLENLRFGSPTDMGHPKRVRRIFKSVTSFPDEHWLMKQLDVEIAEDLIRHQTLEDAELKGTTDTRSARDRSIPWHLRLSDVEKKLIHLSRAFVFSPQILVLHKPFDDLELKVAARILDLAKNYVQRTHMDKKRRTVFVSCGTLHMREQIAKAAEYQWDLSGPASGGINVARRHTELNEYAQGDPSRSPPRSRSPSPDAFTYRDSYSEGYARNSMHRDELERFQEWQTWNDSQGGQQRSCADSLDALQNYQFSLCFDSRKVSTTKPAE